MPSDDYRFERGRVCGSRPVRQDYLDDAVWRHLVRLLADPTLIRAELDRRLREMRATSPQQRIDLPADVLVRGTVPQKGGQPRLMT